MLNGHDRQIGRFAWVMAWVALVGGQLHALSRYRTEDGRGDLDEAPLTAAWAEPADDLLSPMLGWASPDVVYLTYGKLWLPVVLAFTLCAFVVHRRRRPTGAEKWAWRAALTGYTMACVAVAAEYWTQWTGINDALLDGIFLALIPALLLTLLASTFLGIVLLLRGGPRVPAVLLTAAAPALFVVPMVTSLGNVLLPIAFAFGLLGRQVARGSTQEAPRAVPVGAA